MFDEISEAKFAWHFKFNLTYHVSKNLWQRRLWR